MKKSLARYTYICIYTTCFWLVNLSIPVAAQVGHHRHFQHLGIEDGLSQSSVQTILRDREDFIWMGTQDGLNLYDGYRVKVYRNQLDDPNSLSDNTVYDLVEDADGSIWIATLNGLNRFDRLKERFHVMRKEDRPNGLLSNRINRLYKDRTQRIWLITNQGLQYLTPDRREIYTPRSATQIKGLTVMTEGNDGLFWVGTEEGLLRFDPESESYLNLTQSTWNLPVDRVSSLITTNSSSGHEVWVGYRDQGLYCLQPGTGHLRHWQHDAFPGLSPGELYALAMDQRGDVWVGTNFGLSVYDRHLDRFTSYNTSPALANSLPNSFIDVIYVDDTDLVWIGTHGGGLSLYNPNYEHFHHYLHDPANKNSLSNSDIWALCQDSRDIIWASSGDNLLNRLDPSTGKVKHYRLDGKKGVGLYEYGISDILEKEPGVLYLSSGGGGMAVFHEDTEKVELLFPRFDGDADSFNIMYKDSKNNLWLGSRYHGLIEMQANGDIREFNHDPENPKSLGGSEVWSILETHDGTFWVGTYSGVSLLDPRSNESVNYSYHPDDPTSLSNNGVGALCMDRRGHLWVGTDNGLNRFVPETQSFVRYKDKLENQFIYAIYEDGSGLLWMTTNKGLVRFNPVTNRTTVYRSGDGVQGDEFNSGANFQSPDGTLLFGGINGFNVFHPEDIVNDKKNPRVVLTELTLFNQVVNPSSEPDALLQANIDYQTHLVFDHHQDVFSIKFAGLKYASPNGHRYAYKLEGFNRDWMYTDSNDRRATFTNLNAGEYLFRVKAANRDGYWGERERQLRITVLPPPWLSWWAYTLYILTTLLLLTGGLSMHRRMRRTLERRVRERTHELASKNHELDNRYRELAAFDDIITTINREVNLDQLLPTLLQQGCNLIHQAQAGTFLMYHQSSGDYRLSSMVGYEDLAGHSFTYDELAKRYFIGSTEIEEGIFLIREAPPLRTKKNTWARKPSCMLCLRMEVDGELQGVLVMDNYTHEDAFDQIDRQTLQRFRNHAISAVSKACFFQSLENKNREILTKQSQLVTQEKMASLGILTAGVAHELRNPLNFINGLSQVSNELLAELRSELADQSDLMERFPELPRTLEDLERNHGIIKKNGERANTIVQSMISISRQESGRQELADIPRLLSEHVKLVHGGTQARGISFDLNIKEQYDEACRSIVVVPQSLCRVFVCVLNNAMESLMEKRRMQRQAFVPELKLRTRRRGEQFEIAIRDNGMGMSPQVRERIFDHFFTTKPPDQGNIGLGLSISYDIIRQEHGGQIQVQSTEGKYAEFIITLPALTELCPN